MMIVAAENLEMCFAPFVWQGLRQIGTLIHIVCRHIFVRMPIFFRGSSVLNRNPAPSDGYRKSAVALASDYGYEIRKATKKELRQVPELYHLSQCVMIIEETCKFTCKTSKGVPKAYHKKYKRENGSNLKPLDESIIEYVIAVHIIYFNEESGCQYYSVAHLETRPHYLVKKGRELANLKL